MNELKEVQSGKSEEQMEIEMLELCIVICEEYNDLEQIKKIELELGVYSPPRIFYINDKIYVSVTDLQSQKVYLFDSQAKPIANFPVFGNSKIDLADMNNNKILGLVVLGAKNEIITYKLN